MIKVGQELLLGESDGILEVFDFENFEITHTKQFEEINDIFDIIAIEDSE